MSQLYTQVYVTINGKLLLEHASMTLNRSSGAQPVNTVGRGFAGVSPGAPVSSITIENALPVAGFEFNAQDYLKELETVEIGLLAAGLAFTSEGFIMEDTLQHGVSSASGYSFQFMGDFSKFQ